MKVSKETIKDIRHKLFVIDKILALELTSDLDDDNNTFDKDSYSSVDINPERFYFFRFLDKYVEIRRVNKSMNYQIHVKNFIPDWEHLPFDFSKSCDYLLSDNYFGSSSDFSYVLGMFTDIVHSVMEFHVNELF